jgi:hypothetical protein
MITFKDPAVAAKYESDQTADKVHHLPGRKNGNGWKGRLSDIPIEQAERWINQPGQNLLKIKVEPVAKKKEKPSDN